VTVINVAYTMPVTRGEMVLTQSFPAALQHVAVIVEKMGNVRLESPQVASHGEVSSRGQPLIMATGPGLQAGQPLHLGLTGLPYRSRTPVYLTLILAVGILGAGFWAAASGSDTGDEARRRRLELRRDKLMAELMRLEQKSASGRLDNHAYRTRRAEIVARLERVYGELDVEAVGPVAGEVMMR
jgi:hypothetical protein